MFNIKYDKKINKRNIRTFKTYDTKLVDVELYKCCICRRPISIGHSISNCGDRLICMHCATKYGLFNSLLWIRRIKYPKRPKAQILECHEFKNIALPIEVYLKNKKNNV